MSQLSTIIEQGSINMFFSEIFFLEKTKETRGIEVHVINYRDNELKIYAPIYESKGRVFNSMNAWDGSQTNAKTNIPITLYAPSVLRKGEGEGR